MCTHRGATEPCRPFGNGFEFDCWEERNCERCAKGAENNGDRLLCDIEDALTVALFSEGTIPRAIADRMGLHEPERVERDGLTILGWPCKEFEAKGVRP